MRDKFKKLDMWAEYKFWRNRTKQILDEAKHNFYNNMLKESKDPKIIWKCIHSPLKHKFWRNRTKQILDEAKQNFYNNMNFLPPCKPFL